MTTFGQRLRLARGEKGIEQTDLAELAGVHRVTVCMWERDKATPQAHLLARLARVLGRSSSWLIHGVEEEAQYGDFATVCSWCNTMVGYAKPGQQVSHTICPKCKEKQMDEWARERRSRKEGA